VSTTRPSTHPAPERTPLLPQNQVPHPLADPPVEIWTPPQITNKNRAPATCFLSGYHNPPSPLCPARSPHSTTSKPPLPSHTTSVPPQNNHPCNSPMKTKPRRLGLCRVTTNPPPPCTPLDPFVPPPQNHHLPPIQPYSHLETTTPAIRQQNRAPLGFLAIFCGIFYFIYFILLVYIFLSL
jgi:hypothetical protein